jgi:hypothetical protein
MHKRTKLLGAATAVAVVAVGAGTAYGFWTTDGSGTGSATTGEAATLTVTYDGPTIPPISGIAYFYLNKFKVVNPGPAPVKITTLRAKVANADGSPWRQPPAPATQYCQSADYLWQGFAATGVAEKAIPAAQQMIPAGTSYITFAGTSSGNQGPGVRINLTSSRNQDFCKNLTFPLLFSVS